MRLDAGTLHLRFGAEGEDIVANHVFAAVVLMEPGALDVVNQVVFHHDAGAAFVGIEPPSAVVVGINVVDVVVAHGGAWLGAQGVNAAHIAQHAPTEVVDVVELDLVVVAIAGSISPAPADGNAGVAEIADVVVRHLVIGTLTDPHAHRAAVQVPARANDAVVNRAMSRGVGACAGVVRQSDANAAGGHILHQAMLRTAIRAAAAEPKGVAAHVDCFTAVKHDMSRTVGRNSCGETGGRLPVVVPLRRQWVLAMLETQALERQILHIAAALGIAAQMDQVADDRRDDFGLGHIFAGQRDVEQIAATIQKPLAGRV